MVQRMWVLVVGIALFAAPLTASAASQWASEMTYSEQAVGKLKFGLTNTLLGWTSLVRTPVQAQQAGDNVFVGIGEGLVNALGQTVGGALHLATFPITSIDVPLPQGGTDILE